MKPNYTYLVLLFYALIYSNTSLSQSVFSSSKGKLQSQELVVYWTVGETIISTITGEKNFTQGFNQPLIECCPVQDVELVEEQLQTSFHDSDFILYPNPVAEYLNIEINIPNDNMCYTSIYNTTGKLIQHDQQKWSSKQKVFKKIDVSYFEAGQYFIRIYNDDFSSTKKFIVTH